VDVDRVAGAGDRPGTERQRVGFRSRERQAIVIATQRGDVGEEEMRDENRLRGAQMREGRHQRITRAGGLCGKRRDARLDPALQARDPATQIQAKIDGHLFVPRSTGVESPARVAEPLDEQALDKAVHVFVRTVDEMRVGPCLFEDLVERGFDLARLVALEDPRPGERPRPGEAAGHIVLEEAPVETERRAELQRLGVGRRIESAAPQGHQSASVTLR
jgi:hypothetical protein